MMSEAQTVAEKLGIAFRVSLERRIAGAAKVSKHKTSMLQDIEALREPELDALVGSVMDSAGHRRRHAAHRLRLQPDRLLAQTLAAQRAHAAPARGSRSDTQPPEGGRRASMKIVRRKRRSTSCCVKASPRPSGSRWGDRPGVTAIRSIGGINHILDRHVEGASHMAEGYARRGSATSACASARRGRPAPT